MQREYDEEERAVQMMLQATREKPVTTMELEKEFDLSEEESFSIAMEALSEGRPICFGWCEGGWVSFGVSDAPISFWRARTAEDLDEVNKMLQEHTDHLSRLQTGLVKARSAL